MLNNYEIGQILKGLREKKDLSQGKLATTLNERFNLELVQSDISKLEKGTKLLTTDLLFIYAKFFEVSSDYIIGIDNSKDITSFYPSADDITPLGIFKAINYLLVAYGEENIITSVDISYTDLVKDEAGYTTPIDDKQTVPIFKFYSQNSFGKPYIDWVGRYLERVKESKNIRYELSQIGEEKMYIEMLKRWADVDSYTYNKEKKILEFNDDLPF